MSKLYFFADLTIFKKDFKEDQPLQNVNNLRTINKTYNITWGKLRSNNLARDYIIDHREETFKDENGVEYKGYYNAPVDCQMTIDSLKLVIDNYSYEYRGNGCAILEINVEPGFKTIQIEMKMTDHIHNPDILKYKLRYKKGKSIDECYEYKSDKKMVYLHKGNNFIIGNVSYQKEYLKLINTQYVLSSTTTEAFFAGDHPFNSQSCCKSSNVTIKFDQTNCNGFNKYFYNTNPNCVIVKPVMPKDDNIVIPGNRWNKTSVSNVYDTNLNTSLINNSVNNNQPVIEEIQEVIREKIVNVNFYDTDDFKNRMSCFSYTQNGNEITIHKVIKGVSDMVIPDGVTIIKKGAFGSCANGLATKIQKLTIPFSVHTIEAEAFMDNYYLKEVKIEANIKFFLENTFKNCTLLEKVQLPDTTKTIRPGCFVNTNCKVVFGPSDVLVLDGGFDPDCVYSDVAPERYEQLKEAIEAKNKKSYTKENYKTIEQDILDNIKKHTINISYDEKLKQAEEQWLNKLSAMDDSVNYEDIKKNLTNEIEELNIKLNNQLEEIVCLEQEIKELIEDKSNNKKDFVIAGNLLVAYKGDEKNITIPGNIKSIHPYALFGKDIDELSFTNTSKFSNEKDLKAINNHVAVIIPPKSMKGGM